MTRMTILLAAGAAIVAAAAPAAAQYQSPYAYPQQTYPQQTYPQPGYAYPQPGYPQQGYPQGYAYPNQAQPGMSQIIGQLLGNRYQVNDRNAVERCATAAMSQANAQYSRNGYRPGYGNGYGNQGYNPGTMRVTAITDVKRRNNGVRVSGLLDSQFDGRPPYGQAYGYQGQGYNGRADLTFRCNVDYRGAVSNVRIGRNTAALRRSY